MDSRPGYRPAFLPGLDSLPGYRPRYRCPCNQHAATSVAEATALAQRQQAPCLFNSYTPQFALS